MTDLFVCSEDNSYAASKVCKEINKITNRDILPFYITPWHSFINRMDEDGVKKGINLWSIYSRDSIEKRLKFYNENFNFGNLDNELIRQLGLHINVDQSQISDLSNRSYHKGITKLDILNFVDFLIRYYNDVLDKYQPKIIYDLNYESYNRKLLYFISEKRKIKYKTIIPSLFEDFVFSSTSLGEKINDEYITSSLKEGDIIKAREKINLFLKKKSILNKDEIEYSNNLETPLIKYFLKSVYGATRFSLKLFLKRTSLKLKLPKRDSGFMKIINPSLMEGYLYNIRCIFKLSQAKINTEEKQNFENYYYFPLGYTIENVSGSTLGNILSDFEIINKLRIFMHPLTKIIIKEHRSMISERSNKQKKFLKNLKFNSFYYIGEKVTSNIQNNPLNLILNSKGVIVQSGTSGLEGMLLNKPTLIFGNPIYSKFIPKFINPDNPEQLFNFFVDPEKFTTPKEEVEKYIGLVIKYGFRLDMTNISYGTISKQKAKELAKFLVS
tara:strand:- start:945 stop:2435 length:1491 start_codon:yes stop_codon:yes gene_type:complete